MLAEKNKNLKLFLIVNEPTAEWKGETGIINVEIVKQHLPDYKENIFYTCNNYSVTLDGVYVSSVIVFLPNGRPCGTNEPTE